MSTTKNSRTDTRRITMDDTTRTYSEKLDRKKVTKAAENDLRLLNKFNFFDRAKKKTA